MARLRPDPRLYALLVALVSAQGGAACGIVQSATRSGMMPILRNGVDAFVAEPDLVVAEGALTANMKLIEGVAATYPDEAEPLELAAMARANYAFGFVLDELEAVRFAHPGDAGRADPLLARAMASYGLGRQHSERALAERSSGWADIVGTTPLDELDQDRFDAALAELEPEDATALFWLAFNWGGALQAKLDPAAAVQLPKIERMARRLLELDETVFYGAGPHMLIGTLYGFRAPAIGGQPDKALEHFARAQTLSGGLLLIEIMKAQLVYAQTEQEEAFITTLTKVLDTPSRPAYAALENLAKRKACRLWANLEEFFLSDARPLPAACQSIGHKHPLRPAE